MIIDNANKILAELSFDFDKLLFLLIDLLIAWFIDRLSNCLLDLLIGYLIKNLIIVNNTSMFRETLFAANAIYTDLYANPDGSLPVDSNNINKILYQSPYLKSTLSSFFIYFNYIFKLFYILSFTNY